MKRIAYIISDINKSISFENTLKGLKDRGFNVTVIVINNRESELEDFANKLNFSTHRVPFCNNFQLLYSVFKVISILVRNRIQVVHTHLFRASIVGQIAGWLARVPIRVNTRHHSMFHHLKHPKGVYIDRLVNRLCTDIIAPSKVVENILLEKEYVASEKIHLIYHGFELESFAHLDYLKADRLKKKYNPEGKSPVVGIISRYISIKGIEYGIEAFRSLLVQYPNSLLVLANATGDYAGVIKEKLKELPHSSFCEITFENDIHSLYHNFDLFMHIPIDKDREAFGQTYVEALAAGVPSIFTLAGIASEFLVDEHNCLIVPYKDSKNILNSCLRLLSDKNLKESIITNGKADVYNLFSMDVMLTKLTKLYISKNISN